jgi:membrane protein implicated in regulation of membrane protease activity
MGIGNTLVVIAKTADYTIDPGDCGAVFTNRGAGGTVIFTLPVTTTVQAGWNCEFYTVAAQILRIASSPTDNLINHADVGGDTFSTAATIGQHIRVIHDGTGWLIISDPSAASAGTAVTAVTLVS